MDGPQHERPEHEHNQQQPPPPPEPSNDKSTRPAAEPQDDLQEGIDHLTADNVTIFELTPIQALKLLCRGVEFLVSITGDVPPTPAPRSRASSPAPNTNRETKPNPDLQAPQFQGHGVRRRTNEDTDGVSFKSQMGSPEAGRHESLFVPEIVPGAETKSTAIQNAALTRKFYSKRPPPISLNDYLIRLHKYCPLSVAVYLATSAYISHLAVRRKIIPVTPRNVHRLVLAGLRTAMKALEDLSWPHGRFAKVGGVNESELARLEISFCFLMEFGLKMDEEKLVSEVRCLLDVGKDNSAIADEVCGFHVPPSETTNRVTSVDDKEQRPQLTPTRSAEKRKASSSLPMRPLEYIADGGRGISV